MTSVKLILALILLSLCASAQITLDSSNECSSSTCGVIVGTNSNRFLWVVIAAASSNNVFGVTYAGSAMTASGSNGASGFAASATWKVWVYTIVSPSSGSNNVVVSYGGGTIYVSAIALYNVASSGNPTQTTTATGTGSFQPSFISSSANGSWLLLGGMDNYGAGFTSSGCTSNLSNVGQIGGTSIPPGACYADITTGGAAANITANVPFGGNTGGGIMMEIKPSGVVGTMSCNLVAIPANHPGNITFTCAGSGTSWSGGTTVFNVTGVTGVTKVSQNITSGTTATITVTTGIGVGTLTIAETVTGSASTTASVGNEVLSMSASTGTVGAVIFETFTGTNAVWQQEGNSLFSLSGGLGTVFQCGCVVGWTVTSNTTAIATIVAGWNPGTTTLTDNATSATATFSSNAVAAPTITVGATAAANSSTSILVSWTTSTAGSSQAQCTPHAGGSSVSTPVLHPYNYQTGWGVTVHAIPVTGLTASTLYDCNGTTVNTGGTITTSTVSATTSAQITSIQPVVASVSPLLRYNDQYNGINGLPNTGRWCDGDTRYHAWTATGDFATYNDGLGCFPSSHGSYTFGITQWYSGSAFPLSTSNLLNATEASGVLNSALYPGTGAYQNGLLSIQGTMYTAMLQTGGVPNCCGATILPKSSDGWATSISPARNSGPNTSGVTSGLSGGIDIGNPITATVTAATWSGTTVTVTTTLNGPSGAWVRVTGMGSCAPSSGSGVFNLATSNSTTATYTNGALSGSGTCSLSSATIGYSPAMTQGGYLMSPVQPCQDYQYNCVWNANDDGWVYWLTMPGPAGTYWNRYRVENAPLQRWSDWGCYIGVQGTSDWTSDASWTTGGNINGCTQLTGAPYTLTANYQAKLHVAWLPDFGGFVLSTFISNVAEPAWPQGENVLYWLGPLPNGNPVLIGAINRDLPHYPSTLAGFPNPIMATYQKVSSNPLEVCAVWSLSGGLFISDKTGAGVTDNYTQDYQNVCLTAASTTPVAPRPLVSSNSRNGHIASGLDVFYNFQDTTGKYTLVNQSPNDTIGKYNYTSTFPLMYDNQGIANFGPASNLNLTNGITWQNPTTYAFSTPYVAANTSWTVLAVFGHVPYSFQATTINPAVSNEVLLNKSGDVEIIRNGSAASWNAVVNGTTIGAVSIADGNFGAVAIECSSGNASVYNSTAIGQSLPITPTFGPTSVGTCTWGSNPLVIGDAVQSIFGEPAELLIWHRALSQPELIHEMDIIRNDMSARGVTLAGNSMGVSVLGTSNTQAVLQYTAPDSSPCTVAISESPGLTPLVHDVDPILFSGANMDSRSGGISSGTSRTFVAGLRSAQQGLDNNWYSRALQVNTTHYYQVTCSITQATGTFTTGNIPLGNTYNEDVPSAPVSALTSDYVINGQYAWPAFTSWTNRAETVIDPQSGLALKRLTMPQDQPGGGIYGDHSFSRATNPSGSWVNPTNILANDSSYTSYSGSTSDWLVVTDQLLSSTSYPANSLVFSILGWCNGAGCTTGNNAAIQVCITVNGVNCWPSNATANILSITLGTTALPGSFLTAGNTTPIFASWTPAGHNPLTSVSANGNTSIGFTTVTDILPSGGVANVDGSGNVTWVSGTYFYPNWVSGSQITIGSSLCTLTSAATSLAFTITPSSCSPSLTVPVSSATWRAGNFGLMIRKQTSSTDTINLQYAKYSLTSDVYLSWPASGSPSVCSDTQVQNSVTSDLGFVCVVPGGLPLTYWIDTSTGVSNYLGPLAITPQSGTNGWGNNNTSYCQNNSTTLVGTTLNAPLTMYCIVNDNSGFPVMLSCTVTSTYQANNLSISCTNLTPHSPSNLDLLNLMANFTSGQTTTFNSTQFPSVVLAGIQSGSQLILSFPMSQQDTIAWTGVFDPTVTCITGSAPGCIVAAMPSWTTAPARWCPVHTQFQTGVTSTTSWIAGKYWDNPPGVFAGAGPYVSTVTSGTLTSSPSIPAGTGSCPGGSAGCDAVVVDGPPCNSTPVSPEPTGCPTSGHSSYGYLSQDWAVGDYLVVQGHGELMKVVAKSGNTLTLQRAYPSNGYGGLSPSPQNYTGTIVLFTICGAIPQTDSNSWTWNYAADPHGLNSGGTTVVPQYYYDHSMPRPSYVVGGDGAGAFSLAPFGNAYAWTGAGFGLPSTYQSYGPAFSSAPSMSFYNTAVEEHPSKSDDNIATPTYWDIRPAGAVGPGLVGTATLSVSPNLYKFTSTTSDGDTLINIGGATPGNGVNRKLQASMAFCGTQPLTDISSPTIGNQIGGTSSDSYKYCVSRSANECRTGAAQGDVYINCPNATTAACSYGNTDLCLYNTGQPTNAIVQISSTSNDSTGASERMVSKGLIRQRQPSQIANVRTTPDGNWLLTYTSAVNGANDQIIVGKLPPYPSADSYTRNTFIPITLHLTAPSGLSITNAIVEFGYAENISSGSSYLNCTTRQDTCTIAATSVGTPPFQYASEGVGGVETGLAGLSCATTCSPVIPAISGRTLYYKVNYRTGSGTSNTVVATSGLQVYNVVP